MMHKILEYRTRGEEYRLIYQAKRKKSNRVIKLMKEEWIVN